MKRLCKPEVEPAIVGLYDHRPRPRGMRPFKYTRISEAYNSLMSGSVAVATGIHIANKVFMLRN